MQDWNDYRGALLARVGDYAQLNPELMRMAEKAAGSAYGLISLVVSFAMEVLEDAGRSSVHTAGANRILEHRPMLPSCSLALTPAILSWD